MTDLILVCGGIFLIVLAPFAVWQVRHVFGKSANLKTTIGDLSLGVISVVAGCLFLIESDLVLNDENTESILKIFLFLLFFGFGLFGAKHGRWLRK